MLAENNAIKGNEIVDYTAYRNSVLTDNRIIPTLRREENQSRIDGAEYCRETKAIFGKKSGERATEMLHLIRKEVETLVGLITGHT